MASFTDHLETRLKNLEEKVCRAVCDIHGTVTKSEAKNLDRLRRILNKKWDAINGRWEPLD